MGTKIALKILSISLTIVLIIAVIFGLYKVGQAFYDFGYRVYTEPAMTKGEGQDMLVQVTSATTLRGLSESLQEKGLIRDWKLFYVQAKLAGYNVEPGIFTVNTSMTAFEMMKIMTPPEEGEVIDDALSKEEEKKAVDTDGSLTQSWTDKQ